MSIKELLEKKSNLKVSLRVREYKSTFISVIKDRFSLKVSLHKLFLEAPEDIKDAVVTFCMKRDKNSFRIIKIYANEYFSKVDYSRRLDINKLVTKGKSFDLRQIYDNLNLIYFKGKLNLHITWFGKPKYRNYRHVTFGSYDRNLKLVRINKLLDRSDFPFYFINYIVYHEMLHSICEDEITKKGQRRIHTKAFKEQEKKFAYYEEALKFEKIFMKRGRFYGRS